MVENGCREFETSRCTRKCVVTVENGHWRLISSVYESEMGSAVAGEQWCLKTGLVCGNTLWCLKRVLGAENGQLIEKIAVVEAGAGGNG